MSYFLFPSGNYTHCILTVYTLLYIYVILEFKHLFFKKGTQKIGLSLKNMALSWLPNSNSGSQKSLK